MGKNKGTGGKHSEKKTPQQARAYKASFIENPNVQPDDTVDICNESLAGSDSLDFQNAAPTKDDERIKPAPLLKRVWKWLEKNGLAVLLVSSLIAFGAWIVTSIHSNQVSIEKALVKIEDMENNLNQLSASGAETATIEAELEALKSELGASWKIDLADIESRIGILEYRIESLENQ